jgi:hypothetical protein
MSACLMELISSPIMLPTRQHTLSKPDVVGKHFVDILVLLSKSHVRVTAHGRNRLSGVILPGHAATASKA